MNVEEWCAANPDVTKEQLVEELCQWRDRAQKYKELFHTETEAHAKVRSQLKDIVYDMRQHYEANSSKDTTWEHIIRS